LPVADDYRIGWPRALSQAIVSEGEERAFEISAHSKAGRCLQHVLAAM
jgi:hypothetical protein